MNLKIADLKGVLTRKRLHLYKLHLEIGFKEEVINQAQNALSGLQTGGSDKTLLEHYIPQLMSWVVQYVDPHIDEQDDRSADN